MLFSIITITLNADRFLEQSLDSIALQSFSDYEHIVWDGGSKDKSLSIIKNYPSIRLIEGKDSGISNAMNQALSHAKGDFVLFIHADDMLYEADSLAKIACFLRQHPHCLWLYGRAKIIDEKGKLLRLTNDIPYSAKKLRKYNIITHPSCLVKRSVFEEIGNFREDLRYCMDYEYWLRLSEQIYAMHSSQIIACFREHQGSTSCRDAMKTCDEAYKVRNTYSTNLWERYRSYRSWKSRRKKITKSQSSLP